MPCRPAVTRHPPAARHNSPNPLRRTPILRDHPTSADRNRAAPTPACSLRACAAPRWGSRQRRFTQCEQRLCHRVGVPAVAHRIAQRDRPGPPLRATTRAARPGAHHRAGPGPSSPCCRAAIRRPHAAGPNLRAGLPAHTTGYRSRAAPAPIPPVVHRPGPPPAHTGWHAP